MKFKFSLDSVLKVRKHQEKLQEQKLAEKLLKKKGLDELKAGISDSLQAYLEDSGNNEAENIHAIKRHSMHLAETHKMIEKLDNESSEMDKTVKMVREKLSIAHKNRHIMEVVKEIEKNLFQKNQNRLEQKNMDEIATQSYGR